MLKFTAKRLGQTILVVFLALTGVFFLVRLSGDPTPLFLPADASKDQIVQFRHLLGFDRPLGAQYVDFMARAVRGDFGNSLSTKESAMGTILAHFPATCQLAFAAFAVILTWALYRRRDITI